MQVPGDHLNLLNILLFDSLTLERLISAAVVMIGFVLLYFILRARLLKSNSDKQVKERNDRNIRYFEPKKKRFSNILKDYKDEDHVFIHKLILDNECLELEIVTSDGKNSNEYVIYNYQTKAEISNRYEEKDTVSKPIKLPLNKKEYRFLIDEFKNIYLEERCIDSSKLYKITEIDEPNFEYAKDWLESSKNIDTSKVELLEKEKVDKTINFLLQDTENKSNHIICMDKQYQILEYEETREFNPSIQENNYNDLINLPFSHGLEIELQLVKEDCSLIEGGKIEKVYDKILEKARKKLEHLRKRSPEHIKDVWNGDIRKDMDDKGVFSIHINYSREEDEGYYPIFGKDSHVSLKTNILEIQTPPCRYLEEIEWWAFNLYRIANEVVEESSLDISILPLGTNPVDDYSKGVTFGEHHHIYVADEKVKKFVYNSLRYFIPQLIAFSSNSPFNNSDIPEYTFNNEDNLVILDSAYSDRLKKNKEQFCIPPFLPTSKDKNFFENKLKRTDESSRMVDIFPFTRFNTIEVRVFDTQLTNLDRIVNVLLLQSIVSYLKDLYGKIELKKLSEDYIRKNRVESIRNGFFGRLYLDENYRNILEKDDSKQCEYIYETNKHLLDSIWPYIEDMELDNSKYTKLMLLKLLPSPSNDFSHPFSDSQLLLYLSHFYDLEFDGLIEEVFSISDKSLVEIDYHPAFELLEMDQNEIERMKSDISNKI